MQTVITVILLLALVALLVLGLRAWAQQRRSAASQQPADDQPDKTAQRPIWRPGDDNP